MGRYESTVSPGRQRSRRDAYSFKRSNRSDSRHQRYRDHKRRNAEIADQNANYMQPTEPFHIRLHQHTYTPIHLQQHNFNFIQQTQQGYQRELLNHTHRQKQIFVFGRPAL